MGNSVFGFILDPFYEIFKEKQRSTFSILKVNFGVTGSVKINIILTHITQFIQLTGDKIRHSELRKLKACEIKVILQ